MRIVFLAYEGLTTLDLIGPHDVLSRLPGAWEATAAARFRAPFREMAGRSEREQLDHGKISVPIST